MGPVHESRTSASPSTDRDRDRGASASDAFDPSTTTPTTIMRSFEDSVQRLGLAGIDILYAHDIGVCSMAARLIQADAQLRDSGYRALEELRSAGTVRAIGIGVNEREVLSRLWSGATGTLSSSPAAIPLEEAPLDDLLPKCLAAGTSIVVGGLNSASSRPRHLELQDRTAEIVTRVTPSRRFATPTGASCAAALQFPLAHPGWQRSFQAAQCRGASRQFGVAAPSDPGSAVGGPSRRRIAAPRGADAGLTATGTVIPSLPVGRISGG